jgi:hypothetical protein
MAGIPNQKYGPVVRPRAAQDRHRSVGQLPGGQALRFRSWRLLTRVRQGGRASPQPSEGQPLTDANANVACAAFVTRDALTYQCRPIPLSALEVPKVLTYFRLTTIITMLRQTTQFAILSFLGTWV